MKKDELLKIKARQESKIDFLETELSQLNTLLKNCGFLEGIATLREALIGIFMEEKFQE